VSGELLIHKEFARNPQAASLDAPINSPGLSERTIRVLAFVEASTLTGPAKNLIEFARRAAHSQRSLPANIAIATFQRGDSRAPLASNEFVLACQEAGLKVHVIRERFAFDPKTESGLRADSRREISFFDAIKCDAPEASLDSISSRIYLDKSKDARLQPA
jgi:hypothetical protein